MELGIMGKRVMGALVMVGLWAAVYEEEGVGAVKVGYDARGLLFDGQPKLLFSGSIHYPRSTPQMWPNLISKAKEGGLDVVQTYVFWNAHEPQQGIYNFEENLDLVTFIKLVKDAGLSVSLRIGPYINAEWNFGGLPVWLKLQDGAIMRDNNTIFMNAMQNFTSKIVQMMKDEELFAWQGGPIILAQVENEFGASGTSTSAYAYMTWAAKMAVGLDTGVPWIMCKQPDAPNPVINTHNGAINGDIFQPNAPNKPKMWTELYTGWFQSYGKPKPTRSEISIAFEVVRFLINNGSFVNYYMYHGGTNFGRFGGGPFITTSYDYDAPLDEYGLLNQPKWGHLKTTHQALKLCEPALINRATPYSTNLGPLQDVYVRSNGTEYCVAFLSNLDAKNDAIIEYNGSFYDLPAKSVSILPDCKNVAFNTAKVSTQTNTIQMVPIVTTTSRMPLNTQSLTNLWNLSWVWYNEPVGAWGETLDKSECCLEQTLVTKDSSDYLWYITSVEVSGPEDVGGAILNISSIGHAAHIFLNGVYQVSVAGSKDTPRINVEHRVQLQNGTNELAILSMTVGLQSSVRAGHIGEVGIRGPVMLNGLQEGALNLSSQTWTYQVGLKGEALQLSSENGTPDVGWSSSASPPQNQSLIWYKTVFDAPSTSSPLALDLITMGKGQAWVNGNSIGRYWPSYYTSTKDCSSMCDPKAIRCYTGCGESSQRWYHVPHSWLKPTGNLLVLFEEVGGDPTQITLAARSTALICSSVSEDYPAPLELWQANATPAVPEVRLECDTGQVISSIQFASFGTPQGTCSNFSEGPCHAQNSSTIAMQACLGKNFCAIQVTSATFGIDPCPNQLKTFSIIAACSLKAALTR